MPTRGIRKVMAVCLAAGTAAALAGCDMGESAASQPQPSFSWPTALPAPSTRPPGTPPPSFDADKFVPPAVSAVALKAEFAYDPGASLELNINSTEDLPDAVAVQHVLFIVLHRRVTAQVVMPETRPIGASAIVFAHGGAPDPDAWRAEAVALAKRGYVSILPDIPMTVTGDARDDIDYFRYAVVAERRAIDVLIAENLVDPTAKFAFVGHSWGGDLAEIMAGVEPRLAAVVVVSGSSRVATDMLTLGAPSDPVDFMSKVSVFDGYRYLALPGKRRVLIQFGRQDGSIPDAQRDELTRSTYGSHSREDYDAGHDLINFAPAAADRAAFLAAALP